MAENLQKYGIEIGFEDALKKLNKLRVTQKKMNQIQENSLSTQIQLQKRLNALKKAGMVGGGASPSIPRAPTSPQPRTTLLAKQMKQDFAAQAKKNTQFLKEQEKTLKAQQRTQEAISDQLKTHNLFIKDNLSKEEKLVKATLKQKVAEAKTAKEVRQAGVWANKRLVLMKKQTREANKQSFIIQRMQASSQQFAGNMVSAFAVAAGVAGVVRIGQDFEAVNNTMLAVSENAEVAGENFQFVRDEAFRLGLGLTESAKGFSKMIAAQGDMERSEVMELFTGVSEMGTLLGLSAEESNRAINSVMQMMSKGVIAAEELNLGSL